jgi:hypothetical protein
MWAWNGVAYHLLHFAAINPAARVFAAVFVLQAAIFLLEAMRAPVAAFGVARDPRSVVGIALIAFSIAVYPLIGWLVGRDLSATPAFGVAPCPTTIFTLGLLLLVKGGVPLRVLAMPVLWALVGSTAAWLLGIVEDLALLVSVAALAVFRWPLAGLWPKFPKIRSET